MPWSAAPWTSSPDLGPQEPEESLRSGSPPTEDDSMLLTAHQPNYLPYPGFFRKIATADEFLIVDTTQFVKRGPFGWIHRNRIRTPNGPIWLTLPVLQKGRFDQRIHEVELDPRRDWGKKHFKSLQWNYRTSPHWERYSSVLKEFYSRTWTHLAPLNTALIRWFLRELEIDRPVHIASELAARGRSTEYILSFCRELGADAFLSGRHGRDYLEIGRFPEAGIELRFHECDPPHYGPPVGEPGDSLSMIDWLFLDRAAATEWVHRDARDRAPA